MTTPIKHFGPMPALLEEAANIIRGMTMAEFDRLKVRHFLCDELEGSAIMLRELIAENDAPKKTPNYGSDGPRNGDDQHQIWKRAGL